MSLTLGTDTWISLADAELYMATRLGASKFWHTAIDKTAALITAYMQLTGCGKWTLPAEISEDLEKAQCEMALFLLQHLEDSDSRGGLQAQGVVQAGIVQETYDKDAKNEIPIPAIVKQLLKTYESDISVAVVDIHRHQH